MVLESVVKALHHLDTKVLKYRGRGIEDGSVHGEAFNRFDI